MKTTIVAICLVLVLLVAALLCPRVLIWQQRRTLLAPQWGYTKPPVEITKQEGSLLKRVSAIADEAPISQVAFSLGQELYYDRQTLQGKFLEELHLLGTHLPPIAALCQSLEQWLDINQNLDLSYMCVISPDTGDSFFLAAVSYPLYVVMDMTSEKIVCISNYELDAQFTAPGFHTGNSEEKDTVSMQALAQYWGVDLTETGIYGPSCATILLSDSADYQAAWDLEMLPPAIKLLPVIVTTHGALAESSQLP